MFSKKSYSTPRRDGIKFQEVLGASPKSVRTAIFRDIFPFACLFQVKKSSRWHHPIALHFNKDSDEWGPNTPRHLHGHQIFCVETSSGRRLEIESKRLSTKVNRFLQQNSDHFVKVTYYSDIRWEVMPGDWAGLCRLALSCPAFESEKEQDIASWTEKILSDCIARPRPEIRATTSEILRWLSNRPAKDKMTWAELRKATVINFLGTKIPDGCSSQLRKLHSVARRVHDEMFSKRETPQATAPPVLNPTPREDSYREEVQDRDIEPSPRSEVLNALESEVDEEYSEASRHHVRAPTIPLTIDLSMDDAETPRSESQSSARPKDDGRNGGLCGSGRVVMLDSPGNMSNWSGRQHARGVSSLSFVSAGGFDGDDDWDDDSDNRLEWTASLSRGSSAAIKLG